jgi:hypothetical protein
MVDEMWSLKDETNYHWFVKSINNYGVNINIGDYVNFSMGLRGERRSGHLDYFVLRHLGQQFGRSK